MGWDLDVWAQAEEVAPIGLLVLVTVGDDPHTPDGQHRLHGEGNQSRETLEVKLKDNSLPNFSANQDLEHCLGRCS